MKPARSTFQRRYHSADRVWADCYIGYQFTEHSDLAPTKEAVVAWFHQHPFGPVFAAPGCEVERLQVEPQALHEVAVQEAILVIETMIRQAVHYGSNESLPPGEPSELASLFLSEFETPMVFANFHLSQSAGRQYIGSFNQVVSGYGYSCEALLCCVDPRRIGVLLSIENE